MPFDAPGQDAQLATPAPEGTPAQARVVARWLLTVAGMVWVMVALGGATRLTGSGLSIMEWAPIGGALPPLSEAEWTRLYDLYRTTPQYALMNAGFGMEGFRKIFWLEWAHRAWGRLIGLAYALPLLWFWARGAIPAGYRGRLVALLALGGLQGVVGWFMVASGFEPDRTAVAPGRLVLHLGLALALFAALVWTALDLLGRPPATGSAARDLRRLLTAAAALLAAAMLAGGLVAGSRAGLTWNTFPLIDGRWVPAGYAALEPWWRNLTENLATVQFHHRLLASLAAAAALVGAGVAWRGLPRGPARSACLALAAAVAAQYGIGVATLLHVVPVGLGTLHQATAVLVLATLLVALHRVRPAGTRGPSG